MLTLRGALGYILLGRAASKICSVGEVIQSGNAGNKLMTVDLLALKL